MKSGAGVGYFLIALLFVVIVGSICLCQSTGKSEGNVAAKTGEVSSGTVSGNTAKTVKNDTAIAQNSKQDSRLLIVYYLHGTFRCQSCNTIERLTKEAVEQGFANQISKGRIQLKILNVEEPGNEHYVEDYKLYTKSVILSDIRDGKEVQWKNCEKVWTLLHDQAKFIEYIQSEVRNYL